MNPHNEGYSRPASDLIKPLGVELRQLLPLPADTPARFTELLAQLEDGEELQ